MAIHAKSNGLLIGGIILSESEVEWVFKAMDNKRPNTVNKMDAKNQVFDGSDAVEKAIKWQESTRKSK